MPNLTPHQQKLAAIRRDDEERRKKVNAAISSGLTPKQAYEKYGASVTAYRRRNRGEDLPIHKPSEKVVPKRSGARTNSGYTPVRQNMQDVMNWTGGKKKTTKKKTRKSSPRGTTTARPSASSYTVQRGDSLSKIAKKHGMSLKEIIELNPQITNPDIIYVGDKVNLRGSSAYDSSRKSAKAVARPTTVVAEEPPVEVQIPDVNPDAVVRELIGPQPVNVAPVYPNYNPYQMPGPDIRNYMDAPVSRGLPDYNQLMG